MSTFYEHDSVEMQILKKDFIEVSSWIEHLEHIAKELTTLRDIAGQYLIEHDLEPSFDVYIQENGTEISTLYNYRLSLEGQIECQDMDCDTYYKDEHKAKRNKYQETVEKYHVLKNKVIGNL
ncbi:hypothetical protein MQE36_16860 [Zhouia spongiae]|uniref:Uncharacterized protein n=1 Tax=Zhouia spongiae TaxID=2202721 RepID=A0ABY3YLS0_9FLAO|nr:hypothetical protein [Zhouia spongiae]UNY98735.1 hypothetical protein MQE36_16860 [Zhouia spongiae]